LQPSQVCIGIRSGESLVKSLLENSGDVVELARPGGSQVARVDVRDGPPHLHIGDQLGRQGSVRPGRRPFGIEVDLVGELSDQV
jgi:hypothetical protein